LSVRLFFEPDPRLLGAVEPVLGGFGHLVVMPTYRGGVQMPV
jgi:hypothetical protein